MASAPLPEGCVYESLCFHAQQAAEKAVKAVYRALDAAFRYTHDVDELLDGLERIGMDVPATVLEAADITRFAWETRYPGVSEPVAEDEYREAVTHAMQVVRWAESIVEGGRS